MMRGRLLALDPVAEEAVAQLLKEVDVFALVTREEDERLNAAGLRFRVPEDWDCKNPLALYRAAGVAVEPRRQWNSDIVTIDLARGKLRPAQSARGTP